MRARGEVAGVVRANSFDVWERFHGCHAHVTMLIRSSEPLPPFCRSPSQEGTTT
ncbi:hypothetical protein SBD_0820 [Streptomyces bottropensis ATCC 25435]|uniref:Uncharacterized protein n=1 Tax=Streptomyces bottropensis ATCC 25435 TaxID=1054862 RepID=M3F8Z9_9ACTN|nr:hypothetical protein SBD_0820 [Streptomyces bottropensis ATCC 25435]